MKSILKIIGLARLSPTLPLATGTGFDSERCWQEEYLLGASDTDARWYYERRRWRAQD